MERVSGLYAVGNRWLAAYLLYVIVLFIKHVESYAWCWYMGREPPLYLDRFWP